MTVAARIGVGVMFEGTSVKADDVVYVPVFEIPDYVREDVFCLDLHFRRRSISAFLSIARELVDPVSNGRAR
ncbi:hypothetical protein [Breoghania sp.]|uniref:hypothetical protein n=1 Tax=Breoghania sp. TaxID=2065378 RepID=UPI0026311A2E|nr:hypothetical protein [Breoghania sp.]MDJ0932350.1 hypothetical protein [Breoghania sp.]